MKILVCNWKDLTHPAAGGAEVYVDAVARQWVDWGHDVTQFSAMSPGQAPEEEVGGVQVLRRGGRFSVYREARRWYRQHGRGRFDVVIDVVNTRPFLTPTFVHDVPVVALIFQVAREIWSYEVPWPAAMLGRHWLEPRWLRLYEQVPTITISESSRESLKAYGLRRLTIVPVGLKMPTLAKQPPRERVPTVTFLGRLAANKRPDHALRAFCMAKRHLPALQMWVVGSGPLEERLRKDFASEHIRFFGRVSEEQKVELLCRSHAVVVTSVREGWGLVVTEAAIVGTPSIGYDVAGLRDSLRASNGLVVSPTEADLATSLASVLPEWSAGRGPVVEAGGVQAWAQVAKQILSIVELERDVPAD